MLKEHLEFYISYLLSEYGRENGVEVKDIKVRTERMDSVFIGGNTYEVEITNK